MSSDSFDIARDSIDILEYVRTHLGAEPVRLGSLYFINCPFASDEDSTPSFAIYSDHYHCYHCGKHGDITELVMQLKGYSSSFNALKDLNDDYPNLGILDATTVERIGHREMYFKETGRKAHAYYLALISGRWYTPLKNIRGFSEDTIERFQLGVINTSGFDRLAIPFLGERDLVHSFITRQLDPADQSPRYLTRNLALTPTGQMITNGDIKDDSIIIFRKNEHLFNLDRAKKVDPSKIYLMEGQLDVIAAHELGFGNSAAYGTKTLSEAQARLLEPFNRVMLVPDIDAFDTVEKNVQVIRQIYPDKAIGIVDLRAFPAVKDVGDLLKVGRKQQLLANAIEVMKTVKQVEEWLFDEFMPSDRFEMYCKAQELLKIATEHVGRAWLITRVSEELDINPHVLASM